MCHETGFHGDVHIRHFNTSIHSSKIIYTSKMLEYNLILICSTIHREKEENESEEQIWPLGRPLLILATK
jgi:hypothetical protein